MAPPAERPSPARKDAPVGDETTIADLTVEGILPAGLSGRFMRIGPNPIGRDSVSCGSVAADGMVHAVHVHGGRAVSYRNRWVTTDATAKKLGTEPVPGPHATGPDTAVTSIITFGGSVLALGDGSLAYELTADLETIRRVDLAGGVRGLAPHPKLDPSTGELHLVARSTSGTHAHVVIPPLALTRTTRPIDDAPNRIRDLAVSRAHVVVVTDGFIGVMPRTGESHVTWIAVDGVAPHLVHANDERDAVIVHVLGPGLEQWTLHRASASVHRDVLDPTAQRCAGINERFTAAPRRYLWTVTGNAVFKHDLATTRRDSHVFGPDRQPADVVFVTDPVRATDEDGGWLIGFVHPEAGNETELVVLDAADITRPVVATVRIPRRIPDGSHATWIPSDR